MYSVNVFLHSRVVQEMDDTVVSPEKAEEAQLKARYPHLRTKPGGSDLLRKRLQKGVKLTLRSRFSSLFISDPSLEKLTGSYIEN